MYFFFLNALGRPIERIYPIYVNHQNVAQVLWNASGVHCGTIGIHGPVTQLMCALLFQLVVAVIFLRVNDLSLENKEPALSWKFYMYILQTKLQIVICCNMRLMNYPVTPILSPPHT